MITAGDFRKGITVEWDGGVWNIVDFQHVKPGKGAAFVRTKIKNIMTGAVVERSFNPTDKMPRAIIETKEMQYVYNDGEMYYFMDVETYDQIPLSLDQVEDAIPYVKEGTNGSVVKDIQTGIVRVCPGALTRHISVSRGIYASAWRLDKVIPGKSSSMPVYFGERSNLT